MKPFRGDPFKDLTSLQDRMNRLFTESLKRIKEMADPDAEKSWIPAVDIYELPEAFVLLAEVPGVSRESVGVEVLGESLVIKGERPKTQGMAEGHPFRTERRYGAFERTFSLPIRLASSQIQARLADGVLTVTIVKPDEDLKKIKINVE